VAKKSVKSKKYLLLSKIAEKTPYSQEYLSLRARQGKLKAIKVGRDWLTTWDWLKEYREGGNGNRGPQPSATEAEKKSVSSPASRRAKSKKYILLSKAAEKTPYSQEYLSLRARQGKLKAIKVGRDWFTTLPWLNKYTESISGGKQKTDLGAKKKKYFSLSQIAQGSPYSQEYLSLRARQGKLKAIKVGRDWFTTPTWFEEYIQSAKEGKEKISVPETKTFIETESAIPFRQPAVSFPVFKSLIASFGRTAESSAQHLRLAFVLLGLRLRAFEQTLEKFQTKPLAEAPLFVRCWQVFIISSALLAGSVWFAASGAGEKFLSGVGENLIKASQQTLATAKNLPADLTGFLPTAEQGIKTVGQDIFASAKILPRSVASTAQPIANAFNELIQQGDSLFNETAEGLIAARKEISLLPSRLATEGKSLKNDLSRLPERTSELSLVFQQKTIAAALSAAENAVAMPGKAVAAYLSLDSGNERLKSNFKNALAGAKANLAVWAEKTAELPTRSAKLPGLAYDAYLSLRKKTAWGVNESLELAFVKAKGIKNLPAKAGKSLVAVFGKTGGEIKEKTIAAGTFFKERVYLLPSSARRIAFALTQFSQVGNQTDDLFVRLAGIFYPDRIEFASYEDKELADRLQALRDELQQLKEQQATGTTRETIREITKEISRITNVENIQKIENIQNVQNITAPDGSYATPAELASLKSELTALVSKNTQNVTQVNQWITYSSFDQLANPTMIDGFTVESGNIKIETNGFITQSGSGQITLKGNIDANGGLDVAGADLTVGGANFSVDQTGNLNMAGQLTLTGTATSTLAGDVYFDTDTLVVDSLNNFIGIGTSTPFTTFSVVGDSYFDGAITVSGGQNINGDFSISGNTILGDATSTDVVFLNSRLADSLVPTGDNLLDLGDGTNWLRWRTGYFGTSVGIGGIATSTGTQLLANGEYLIDTGSTLSINTTNNQQVIFGSGNVGIGVANPTSLFTIASTTADTALTFTSGAGSWTLGMDYSEGGKFKISSSTVLGTADRLTIDTNGYFGIGTTSPWGFLSVNADGLAAGTPQFVVGSSTATNFIVANGGNVGIGTVSPEAKLHIHATGGAVAPIISTDGENDAYLVFRYDADGTPVNQYVGLDYPSQNVFLGPTVNSLVVNQAGNVGIGTSTPAWLAQISGTRPSLALSDYSSGADLKHWLFSSMGGNLYVGTSTDSYATSSPAALTILNNGNVGIGTSTPAQLFSVNGNGYLTGGLGIGVSTSTAGVLQTSGYAHFGGDTYVAGNLRVISNSTSDTLTVVTSVNSDLIPDENVKWDLGSAAYYWDNIFVDTIVANNLSAASSTVAGTTAETFTINSDNLTADTEDETLIFFRGTVVPNALLGWDSHQNRFDFNQSVFIQDDSHTSATSTLLVQGWSGQTSDIFRVASSSAETNSYFNVTAGGNVGIGTTAPSDILYISGTGDKAISIENTEASGVRWRLLTDNTGTFKIRNQDSGFNPFVIESDATSNSLYLKAGNVGIGTTDPLSVLHIVNSGAVGIRLSNNETDDTAKYGYIIGSQYDSGTETEGAFMMGSASTDNGTNKLWIGGGSSVVNAVTEIQFYTAANSITHTGTQQMTINSSGNVGIGSTTPHAKLSVTNTGSTPSFIVEDSTSPDTTPFIIDAGGNVGIGTTNPGAYKIAAQGSMGLNLLDASAESYLQAWNCSAEGGCFAIYRDGGSNRAAEIRGDNGATYFGYNNNGNVGIGTNSPGANFEVSTSTSLVAQFTRTGSAGGTIRLNSDSSHYADIGYTYSTNLMSFGPYGQTSALNINTNGNVGIGSTTPSYKLSVAGSAYFDGGTVIASGFTATSSISAPYFTATSASATSTFAGGLAIETSGLVYDYSTNNVGIGTAAPEEKLHVKMTGDGVGIITAETNDDIALRLNSTYSANNGAQVYIEFDDGFIADGKSWNIGKIGGSNNFAIGRDTLGAFNSDAFLSIQTDGNVGIGTTTPVSLLNIANATAPKITISDTDATTNQKHWFIESNTGSFTIGTTSDALANNATYRALTINSSGNVGIGTTNSRSSFHISSSSLSYSPTIMAYTDAGQLSIGQSASEVSANDYTALSFHFGQTGRATAMIGLVDEDGTSGFSERMFFSLRNGSYLVERMAIDESGYVGIGSTTPWGLLSVNANGITAGTPQFVVGSSSATNFVVANGGNIGIGTAAPGNLLTLLPGSGKGLTIRESDNGNDALTINSFTTGVTINGYTAGAQTFLVDTSTGGKMYFTNGNVGIGTTTPMETLHVYNSAGGAVLGLQGTGVDTVRIEFQAANGSTMNKIGRIGIEASTLTAGAESVGMYFSTVGSGTLAERMRITNTGNVGIGTTTPGFKLDVETGSSYARFRNGGGIAALRIESASNSYSVLQMGDVDDGDIGRIYYDQTSDFMSFYTSNYERMRITSAGNVGIGSTTPYYKLSVAGSAYFDGGTVIASGFTATSSISAPYFTATSASATSTFAGGLAVETSGLVYDYSTNNVGIGTAGPGSTLEIYNTNSSTDYDHIRMSSNQVAHGMTDVIATNVFGALSRWGSSSGGIKLSGLSETGEALLIEGSAGIAPTTYPAIEIRGYLKSGTSRTSLGNTDPVFGVSNTTTRLLTVLGNGNVGIGTTTPVSLLNIANATAPKITISDTDATTNQKHWFIESNTGSFAIGTTSDALATNATYRALTINSSGNVGIGTVSPGTKLTLYNSSGIDFINFGTSGGTYFAAGANSTDGYYYFDNTTGSSASPDVAVKSGNVGIGTTTPYGKLNISAADGSGRVLSFTGANSTTRKNWMIATQQNYDDTFEITPSTANGGLTFSTPALVIKGATSYVGIGTTSPMSLLALQGNSAYASFGDDTGGLGMKMGSDTSGNGFFQMFSSGTERIRLYAHPTAAEYWFTNGNVGIGTTAPYKELEVYKAGDSDILINSSATTDDSTAATLWFRTDSSVITSYERTKGAIIFRRSGTYGVGNMYFALDDSADNGSASVGDAKMTILSGGNVGIGTTAPGTELEIYKTTSGATVEGAIIDITGVADNNDYSGIRMGFDKDSGYKVGIFYERTTTYSRGKLHFATSNTEDYTNLGLSDARMTIDNTGNVGIGTTVPGYQLQIGGASSNGFSVLETDGGNSAFQITRDSAQAILTLYDRGGSGGSVLLQARNSGNSYFNGGNVGIGTTSPTSRMEVVDSVNGIFNGLTITNTQSDDSSGRGSSLTMYSRSSKDVYGQIKYFRNTSPDGRYLDFINSDTGSTAAQRFLFSTNERMRITSAGNVGIGSTTPSYKLSVAGSAYFDGGTVIASGFTATSSISAPYFTATSASATSTFAGGLAVETSGLVYNYSLDKVGIGTANPERKLHVYNSDSSGTPYSTASHLLIESATTAALEFLTGANSDSRIWFSDPNDAPGGGVVYSHNATDANESMNFYAGNTVKLTILGGGNVGIGTTAPGQKLHIENSAGDARLRIVSNTASDAAIQLGDTDSATQGSIIYSNNGDAMRFQVNNSEQVRITSTGNVGIGTTAPGAKIEVYDSDVRAPSLTYNSAVSWEFGSSAVSLVGSVNTVSPYGVWLQARNNTAGETAYPISLNPLGGGVGVGTTSPWGLLSIDAPAGSPSFVVGSTTGTSFIVNKSGFVGIGTAVPTQKLQVQGTGYATTDFRAPIFYDSAATSYYLDPNNSGTSLNIAGGITLVLPANDVGNHVRVQGGILYYDTGVCPFFYSWTGEEYKRDTSILEALAGKYLEGEQEEALNFMVKNGKILGKISMEEPETAYIDMVKIIVEDSLGENKIVTELKMIWASKDLEKLLSDDGNYSVNQLGEEILVEFGEAPALAEGYSRTIKVASKGYYDPDFPALATPEWRYLSKERMVEKIMSIDAEGNVNEFRPMVLRNLDEFGYETPENMLTVNGGTWLRGLANGIGLRVDHFGNVGIGTTTPNHELEVVGDIAAQGFINLSTKDAKTGIEYLTDVDYETALSKISGEVKVATYYYIGSEESIREKRLGLIAEESPSEVLSVDGKGVDLYKLSSFTLMGVKALDAKVNSQQTAIDSLASRIESLEAAVSSGALNAQADFNEALTTVSGESITLSQESVDTLTENLLAAVISGLRNLGLSIEQGMMKVKSLAADLLYTRKLAIADQPQGDDDPTIGTAMLAIGDTEVFVLNNQITDTVRIFVTPESAQPVGFTICEKNSETINIGGVYKAQGFRICISESAEQEVKFNWWLVETATNDQISMPDDQTSSQPSTSPQPSPFQEEGAEEVSVSPLASPEASATPTSSETPAVSESPLPSESPAVSESPEPEPEESASPEPSTSPEPEVTPELLPVSE